MFFVEHGNRGCMLDSQSRDPSHSIQDSALQGFNRHCRQEHGFVALPRWCLPDTERLMSVIRQAASMGAERLSSFNYAMAPTSIIQPRTRSWASCAYCLARLPPLRPKICRPRLVLRKLPITTDIGRLAVGSSALGPRLSKRPEDEANHTRHLGICVSHSPASLGEPPVTCS